MVHSGRNTGQQWASHQDSIKEIGEEMTTPDNRAGRDKITLAIITFLLGCTLTAGGYTLSVSNGVTENRVKVDHIEADLAKFTTLAQEVIKVNQALIGQNQILINQIEIEAQKRSGIRK